VTTETGSEFLAIEELLTAAPEVYQQERFVISSEVRNFLLFASRHEEQN
jgi:hypothetical protein